MVAKKSNIPLHQVPTKARANSLRAWETLLELITESEYDAASEILRTAISEAGKENPFLVNLLTAAHRLIRACGECRLGAELHRGAITSITKHEKALLGEIDGVLQLVAKDQGWGGASALSSNRGKPEKPEDKGGFGFGKRLQGLFGRNRKDLQTNEGNHTAGDPFPGPSATDGGLPALFPSSDEMGASKPRLAIYCLGPFQVYQEDKLIEDWDGHKGTIILKYLVAHRKKSIAKDIIMDVLWPEADPDSARRNLHQAIYCLRQALRQTDPRTQYIEFFNDRYNLSPKVNIWVDVEEFEERVMAGRRLEASGEMQPAAVEYGIAESLYQGDFLEEDLYTDWPRLMRDRIHELYLETVDRLIQYYLKCHEIAAAINLCKKVLVQDQCNENMHLRLVQSYLARGQRHLAVRQFHACRKALKRELDLKPSEDLVRVYRSILGVGT